MKFLTIALVTMFMLGCSDDPKSVSGLQKQVRNLKQENEEIREANTSIANELKQCQSAYDLLKSKRAGSNIDDVGAEEDAATVEETKYEEVEYVSLKGAKCYDREVEACGMSFSNCTDNNVYRCMKDVVYQVKTEKRKVE